MAEFRPFRGIRYNEALLSGDFSKLICPPYDVISPEEQAFYYDLHPQNAIRLDFGKTFPEDNEQDNRYVRAEACFRQWISEGTLLRDTEPAYYLIEEHFESEQGRPLVRYGIMGLKRLEENRPGTSVRPHEATYAGPKQDRFELMKATGANFSPIFAVYQDPSLTVEKIFSEHLAGTRFIEAEGRDGVRRRLFVLRDKQLREQVETFLSRKTLLIADGHHRYETSLTYRDWRRALEKDPEGTMPYDYTLMYIANMESPGLCVYPAHRIVRGFSGLDPDRFLRSAQEIFEVEKMEATADPSCREHFFRTLRQGPEGSVRIGCCFKDPDLYCILTANNVESLSPLFPPETPSLLHSLDVSILHEIVLGRCMGLSKEEQEHEERLIYAKGEENALDLLAREPDLKVAFLLNPAPVQKIMKIAFAGILMPHKTTYFFPKVMTGLLFRKMG